MNSLPNILTLLRIFLIIPILYLLLGDDSFYNRNISSALFLIASGTDFFDGYLARKFNIKSKFGTIFDPIADKVLVLSLLIALTSLNRVSEIVVIIIAAREIIISGIRESLSSSSGKDKIELKVTFLSKIKTAMQMIGIFFCIYGSDMEIFQGSYILSNYLMNVTVFLTIFTAIDHIKKMAL